MPSTSALAVFCLASFVLAVVPGPAVTYIVAQSVDKGRRAGLACALGVWSGGLVHVAAATVGVSALIASSAAAFTTVKLVGAAYLIYIGVRRILAREEDDELEPEQAPHHRLYVQGVVVNVLNPKTALFFVAFLPQFVDLVFSMIALISDSAYALTADLLAGRLRRSGRGARFRRILSGGIFIALGVSAAGAHRTS
jgi:threonine/homoserine/homoserine lactone efflux protein